MLPSTKSTKHTVLTHCGRLESPFTAKAVGCKATLMRKNASSSPGLQKECKGHKPNSPTLAQFFSQTSQGTQPKGTPAEKPSAPTGTRQEANVNTLTGHETQPAPFTPPQYPAKPEGLSPPAPKKLRFSTSEQHSPPDAQPAMTPSHAEQGEEEHGEGDPEVNADSF